MSNDAPSPQRPEPVSDKAPGFFDIVLSTVAAAFGVQSKRNYQRDFKNGNIWVFIAAGVIFTVLFVAVVAAIVTTVLSADAG